MAGGVARQRSKEGDSLPQNPEEEELEFSEQSEIISSAANLVLLGEILPATLSPPGGLYLHEPELAPCPYTAMAVASNMRGLRL